MAVDGKPAFPILRYFEYTHLPHDLQLVSMPFYELAHSVAEAVQNRTDPHDPAIPETAAGLRKLLEAKDCIVRAALNG